MHDHWTNGALREAPAHFSNVMSDLKPASQKVTAHWEYLRYTSTPASDQLPKDSLYISRSR